MCNKYIRINVGYVGLNLDKGGHFSTSLFFLSVYFHRTVQQVNIINKYDPSTVMHFTLYMLKMTVLRLTIVYCIQQSAHALRFYLKLTNLLLFF